MSEQGIFPLQECHLEEDFLNRYIYPDMTQDYFWSDDWSIDFYIKQARAGFISTCLCHENTEYLLLPEIQKAYAVLDWQNLYIAQPIKRLISKDAKAAPYIQLSSSVKDVIRGIENAYGSQCWMHQPYIDLMNTLSALTRDDFSLIAIELRDSTQNKLIAGEIGYVCGTVYTSLSGFLHPDRKTYNNMGTLQLCALAALLEQNGFSFWNLGHPYMDYKRRLGAQILLRQDFLTRWKNAIHGSLSPRWAQEKEKAHNCVTLLQTHLKRGLA